jgi:hypothetical protein
MTRGVVEETHVFGKGLHQNWFSSRTGNHVHAKFGPGLILALSLQARASLPRPMNDPVTPSPPLIDQEPLKESKTHKLTENSIAKFTFRKDTGKEYHRYNRNFV